MRFFELNKLPLDKAAVILCFVFGLFMLLFVVSPGDGGWILYGREILSGRKIYSDLHVNQQPLFFVISTAVAFLSDNILLQHMLYIPILGLFCFSIFKIASVAEQNRCSRALLVLAIFFFAIRFEAYRFDDYHALAHALVLLSMALSVEAIQNLSVSTDRLFFFQGLIFGIVFTTRVNEGLVIFSGVIAAGTFLAPTRAVFIRYFSFFLIAAVFSIAVILYAIGESPVAWIEHTIYKAIGNKGGGGVFSYPLNLIMNSTLFIWDSFNSLSLLKKTILMLYAVLFLPILFFSRRGFFKYIYILCGFVALLFYLYKIEKTFVAILLPLLVLLLALSVFIFLFGALYFKKLKYSKLLVILTYPVALFIFGSLSSGGRFQDLTFPAAALLAVFPLCLAILELPDRSHNVVRLIFLTVLAVLVAEGVYQRTKLPYQWHSYTVPPLFSSDYKFDHDYRFGTLLLSSQVAELVKPVCGIVSDNQTLISLPFSFANYYCGIPVWHGYVQSFFDTAGPVLVNEIIDDLQRNPPDYIFYQRQYLNLSIHESIFNHGYPIPHRKLDELIMRNLNTGKWEVVYRSDLFPPSDWLLIKTIN